MPTLMTRFLKNRTGAAAIEFALIGVLVSIAIISAAALLAGNVDARTNDAPVQLLQMMLDR